jgi:hypothetical protein
MRLFLGTGDSEDIPLSDKSLDRLVAYDRIVGIQTLDTP